jgi:hypothetical protein
LWQSVELRIRKKPWLFSSATFSFVCGKWDTCIFKFWKHRELDQFFIVNNCCGCCNCLSIINRLSENTKSENLGVDIKGFMTRKSVKISILGQPVKNWLSCC